MNPICVVPGQEDVDNVVDRLADQMAKSPIQRSIVRSVAGGVVGNAIDKGLAEDNEDMFPLFTVMGLLAGTKTGIKATRNLMGHVKAAADPLIPGPLKQAMEADREFRELEVPEALGFNVDPRDKTKAAQVKEVVNGIRNSALRGRNVMDDFFNSGWVKSQFSTLRSLGKSIPMVNKLNQVLTDIPNQIKLVKKDLDALYNTKGYGHTYQEFLDDIGPKKIQAIFERFANNADPTTGQGLRETMRQAASDPKIMYREFNDAVARFNHSGFGTPNQAQRRNLEQYYQQNSFARAIDEALLQDQEFMNFIGHNAEWFGRIETRFKKAVGNQISKYMTEIKAITDNTTDLEAQTIYRKNVIPLMQSFLEGDQTWRMFKDTINESGDAALKESLAYTQTIMKNDAVRIGKLLKSVTELRNRMDQFDRFSGAYFPQIESDTKKAALKQRLMRDPNSGVTDDESFENWLDDQYFEINFKNDRKLYQNEKELDNYNVRQYGSRTQAVDDLRKQTASNPQFTMEERLWAEANLDRFIKEGEMRINGKTKKFYTLEVPENAPTNYFSKHNKDVHKAFIRKYRNLNNVNVKQSARLDKTRRMEMPWQLVETDIRYTTNRYANDVAPRLHAIENDMFDIFDLQENYLAPIMRSVEGTDKQQVMAGVLERITDIYNTSFRINNLEGNAYTSFEKQARFANAWRNLMASAYQYGIGFYNIFEPAVVAPLITSWGAFGNSMKVMAFNRDAANAWVRTMADFHIMDRQLKSQAASQAYFDEVAGRTWVERSLEKAANFSADASLTGLTKFLGNMYISPDRLGVLRLAFGSFTEGNLMSTAINAQASLYEVQKMARVYKQLQKLGADQAQVVRYQGKQYNMADIKRTMEYFGIGDSQFDGFMSDKTQNVLQNMMERLKAGQTLSQQEYVDNATELNYITTIMNYATEAFHGTNPIFRPEQAQRPVGRLAYQYSSYSYNMAFQNYQRKIRFPFQDWKDKHAVELGKAPMLKFHYHYKMGQYDELAKMGFSKEAIESYPMAAMDHTVKLAVAAFGISTLGNASIDFFRDLVAYPFKEDEKDQWARLKRRTILNPLAKKEEQRTWGDLVDDFGSGDIINVLQYFTGMAFDNGFAGRYDAFYSTYGRQSLTDLTPVTRAANDLFRDTTSILSQPFNISETVPKTAFKYAMRYMPIIGSSPFSEGRNTIQKMMLQDKKRPVNLPSSDILDLDLLQPDLLTVDMELP